MNASHRSSVTRALAALTALSALSVCACSSPPSPAVSTETSSAMRASVSSYDGAAARLRERINGAITDSEVSLRLVVDVTVENDDQGPYLNIVASSESPEALDFAVTPLPMVLASLTAPSSDEPSLAGIRHALHQVDRAADYVTARDALFALSREAITDSEVALSLITRIVVSSDAQGALLRISAMTAPTGDDYGAMPLDGALALVTDAKNGAPALRNIRYELVP